MNTLHKNAFLAICLLTLTAQIVGAPSHAQVKRLIKNGDQRALERIINNAPDITIDDLSYFIRIAQAAQQGCDKAQQIGNFESNAKTQKVTGSIAGVAGVAALAYGFDYLCPSDDDTDEKDKKREGVWKVLGALGVGCGGIGWWSGIQNASQKTAIDGKKGGFIAIENYLREVRNRPHAGPAAANHDSGDDDDNNAFELDDDTEMERLEAEIHRLNNEIRILS